MAAATKRNMRTCYYEVLGLPRTANADEIKTAYRKLALVWHPDKNAHRMDEATEKFKELSNAYTTLSDPQEKAWYDQHREQILRGSRPQDADKDDDDEMDLFQYFSASAYEGFGDDDAGFFHVYESVFRDIDEAEEAAAYEEEEHHPGPKFGRSTSEWVTVQAFYSYWESFSTIKGFYGSDMYRPDEGPTRQHRRLMEKANAKERSKAKKAFNETVRSLVIWVKKRDPRVAKRQKEVANEKKMKEQEEARQKLEREKQAAEMRKKHVQEIHVDHHMEKLYADMEKKTRLDSDGEEDEEERLYCVACKKYFRSEKQLESHQRSKKHLENVLILRELLMEEEEEGRELSENGLEGGEEAAEGEGSGEGGEERTGGDEGGESEEGTSSEDERVLEALKKSKLKRKKKMEKKKQKGDWASAMANSGESEEEEHPDGKEEDSKERGAEGVDAPSEGVEGLEDAQDTPESEATPVADKKMKRAKKKKEKEKNAGLAAAVPVPDAHVFDGISADEVKGKKAKKKFKEQMEAMLFCGVCKQVFETRNAMFKHINATGHALPPDEISKKGKRR